MVRQRHRLRLCMSDLLRRGEKKQSVAVLLEVKGGQQSGCSNGGPIAQASVIRSVDEGCNVLGRGAWVLQLWAMPGTGEGHEVQGG